MRFAGDIGTVVEDDGGSKPFRVKAASGAHWWYTAAALERVGGAGGSGGGGHRLRQYEAGVNECRRCGMLGPSVQTGDEECASCRLCSTCCKTNGCEDGGGGGSSGRDLEDDLRAMLSRLLDD